MGFFKRLFGKDDAPAGTLALTELARRLGMSEAELAAVRPAYSTFKIPKRSGGQRTINAPHPALKTAQRRVLRRLLTRLKAHPAATAYEHGHSIATHAAFHAGRAVVVRMDLRDFFTSTKAARVRAYFGRIGWDAAAADRLTALCTHEGGLPQGAPTSPRLSNLLNWQLDARLQKLADKLGARYSRYADDLTFSFESDDRRRLHSLISCAKLAVEACGYELHMKKKLHIRRRHQRQVVTGLVVNERARLPRETRRWLRAVEHRIARGGQPTITGPQLAGWRALAAMIEP